jgi:hypothetical protein
MPHTVFSFAKVAANLLQVKLLAKGRDFFRGLDGYAAYGAEALEARSSIYCSRQFLVCPRNYLTILHSSQV